MPENSLNNQQSILLLAKKILIRHLSETDSIFDHVFFKTTQASSFRWG